MTSTPATELTTAEADAQRRDAEDPGYRAEFHIPPADGGRYPDSAYLLGNSLGLQPIQTKAGVLEDLDVWARSGVEGHFEGARPWADYQEMARAPMARLVGARPAETVLMNSLTVNLHLLMVSFYRPTGPRTKLVVEDAAFPSDSYAVRSQTRFHGLDPDRDVVRLRPRAGEDLLRTEDIVDYLARNGDTVALVLLGGINYLTGQFMDIPAITAAGHAAGAMVGWDLAHAAGNVPLRLHDWDADFAAWCCYKYLNGGPGAVGGAFVHERHHGAEPDSVALPRFEGWWGNDPATRFEMAPVFRPLPTVDAWTLSNASILAMGPVRTALEQFDRIGLDTLRARSERLTVYLAGLLDEIMPGRPLTMVTPPEPERRGAQLSVRVNGISPAEVVRRLRHEHGVLADAREPDIVRFAPAPLYSTYHDCWRAAAALAEIVAATG